MYVSRFEQECRQGKRMSERLRKVLMAYQHRVSAPGRHDPAEAKEAVLLSGSLLQDLRAVYPEIAVGRRVEAGTDNAVQSLANLLNEIVSELKQSIAAVEGGPARLRMTPEQTNLLD
jgi:hypothetical protein